MPAPLPLAVGYDARKLKMQRGQQMGSCGNDELDAHITSAIAKSHSDGAGGWDTTALRWWIRFHVARGEDPFALRGPDASTLTQNSEPHTTIHTSPRCATVSRCSAGVPLA